MHGGDTRDEQYANRRHGDRGETRSSHGGAEDEREKPRALGTAVAGRT